MKDGKPVKPTSMKLLPTILRAPKSVFSGRKLHPPKKPCKNRARICSSVRSPISEFRRLMDIESGTVMWLRGLTMEKDLEVDLAVQDVESVSLVISLRELVSGRGRW